MLDHVDSALSTTEKMMKQSEVADYCQLSEAYLQASRGGRCDGPPYVQIGRAIRYRLRDVEAWLESKLQEAKRKRSA